MTVEVKVPEIGESITEVEIGKWLKAAGDHVARDEPLVVIESDKASIELPSPADGVLARILQETGATAAVGAVLGEIDEGEGAATSEASGDEQAAEEDHDEADRPEERAAAPEEREPPEEDRPTPEKADTRRRKPPAPARRQSRKAEESEGTPALEPPEAKAPQRQPAPPVPTRGPRADRSEQLVPMTRLRRTIAERLVRAQQTAALATTYNEIDLSEVLALRQRSRKAFREAHGSDLGLMSFFVRASVNALREFPVVNAEVREDSIAYRDHHDIGIAVATDAGLVVPVLRNADRMGFGAIERAIADFAARARERTLEPADLEGGTFTISNGGVFGSLLSTPIVNPPQSGILGMHAVQDRPVARDGEVVIRPMMYVALTYDHRIVDGREAVGFLRTVKEDLEQPMRLLLEF